VKARTNEELTGSSSIEEISVIYLHTGHLI
jgi:hypothetical protein